MSIPVPTLPNNPRIKKVELKLYRLNETESQNIDQMIGIYEVTEDIVVGTCTPKFDSTIKGYIRIDKDSESNLDKDFSYNCFDITSIFEKAIDSGKEKIDLLLKDIDETNGNTYISVSAPVVGAAYNPELMITYESSYAVNESYRTHTHQLGRFGQGSIDLQCGNLMFECEDFAWLGNRMPVTIKHLYNSAISEYQYTDNANIALNVADFSAMKIGKGFKLNLMQGIRHIDNYTGEDGKEYDKEVFVDESGKEIYLITDHELYSEYGNINCLRGEEGSEEDFVYDPPMNIATRGDEKYYFDDKFRVNKIEDKDGNTITINYTSDRISSVTDGAGRDFTFTYNNGFLKSICAPGDDDNVTIISYEYSGEYLSGITYPDGRKVVITYKSSKPETITLFDKNGVAVYKVEYLFNGDKVESVTEYGVENGVFVKGASSTYSFSITANRTTVTTTEVADSTEENDNVIKTVYCFDDDGNIISEYAYSEDTGNDAVSGSGSGINPYLSDGGVKSIRNVINLIKDGNFECACKETGESNFWTATSNVASPSSAMPIKSQDYSEFGRCCMEIVSKDPDVSALGVYQQIAALSAGEYTFSCYVKPKTDIIGNPYNNLGAYIRVVDAQNNIIAESEHLTNKESSYYRLILPFTLTSSQEIKVMLLVNGCGEVLFDGAQLENNPFASEFNMIENASFEEEYAWEKSFGNGKTTYAFDGESVMILPGNIDLRRQGKQTIYPRLSKDVRETFTLSGWAKGSDCLPNRKDEEYSPQFRLKAKLYYADKTESEEAYADFCPCCDEWQYTSVQFSKSKYAELSKIEVVCEYNYNSGSALFDSIQLVRDSVETGLSEGDFGTGGGSGYSGDNVDTTKAEFTESVDGYGNTLTETTYFDGELGTIYRSFEFDADYNNLTKEVDARGNETTYTVDAETSRNEEIEDRLGNKTAYEYDAAGRTTKVTSKNSSNEVLAHVGYSYDAFDNMTEIVRGDGMKYMLKYNAFHNLESIGIDGKNDGDLIKYTYKNGNGRLKEITYANGDKMKASYNSIGQMIAEKWFDKHQNVTAFYKYAYDNNGNIVRSIDISGKKEYDYVYKDSKIVTATEYVIQVDASEMITSKTVVSTARYYYDGEDKLLKKIITFANGKQSETYYQHGENDAQAVKLIVNGKPVTSHSNTDSFGRKEFDELQLGTKSVWRKFNYHAGEVTQEHISAEKVKSTPTTQLVSKIEFSDGRELLYEYDAEERITKVIDKQQEVSTTTEYTYDALGQLLEEKVNNETVNLMTYDTYGNIRTKNGVEYSYCDGIWKDKLTGVGEQTITYDAQGNPTSYLGHTLTWEKGRQLKSFDNITYTYNANGIRTSKTVDGVKHEYTLDGTKVLCEEWNGNTLIPMYDNEDSICGIIYNDEPYYFIKNLQGDVITIVDKNAQTVAKYSYDAWGVCDVTFDCTAIGIATINPYRYRGYFFDKEIGLYYVSSRYYDPEIGRFINADNCIYLGTGESALSYNLFSYCRNNLVNMSDTSGDIPVWILYAVAGAALFGGVTYVIGKAIGLSKKALVVLTAIFATIGATAAAILGVKFLAKSAPKLAKWAQKVAKNTKFFGPSKSYKTGNYTSLGGLILFDAFKIMLHPPHANNHNFWHIQIEIKLPGVNMTWIKFRIRLSSTVILIPLGDKER